jgi:ankyrin repeat protein
MDSFVRDAQQTGPGLLIESDDANVVSSLNAQLLIAAARNGFKRCALLLKQGAEVNAHGRDGRTALSLAAQWGHVKVCRVLLKHGADPNICDKEDGFGPLHWAARMKRAEIREELLSAGVDVDARGSPTVPTALHQAIRARDYVACISLLDRGANVNLADGWGCSALHYAVGGLPTIDFCFQLILRGADLHSRTTDGRSILQFVQGQRNAELYQLLIACGASTVGCTPFYSEGNASLGMTPLEAGVALGIPAVMMRVLETDQEPQSLQKRVADVRVLARTDHPLVYDLLTSWLAKMAAEEVLATLREFGI